MTTKHSWAAAVELVDRLEDKAEKWAIEATGHKYWHVNSFAEGIGLIPYDSFGESMESNFFIEDRFYTIDALIEGSEEWR